ncbi:MAG: class I SAM-dependent methyltransferase [Acidobacteria bacterium]|nr:MAG: class I SAM-dependent methyltransferase [Acidobacteriota bacterium]REJ98276.1 MAG: class I SAM-dependent methyltransferase [Acidobacteriota bacterium]REK17020.1 MAG: class I SAM-dependent methyltransferase [Acidobacteriota bacterium]REK42930.1 MAG: class I SAM-dependent methyltransferase [Acidobacteriota bacterium]
MKNVEAKLHPMSKVARVNLDTRISGEIANDRLKLVEARCCLCETEEAKSIATGEDFEYLTSDDSFEVSQCQLCSLVYLNPRPDISEFERIYPPEYHAFEFSEQEFGLVYRIRRKLEAKRLLRWCTGLKQKARILDVGCGDGFHLGLLEEFGEESWELEGIDLDQRAVDIGRKQGLNIRHGSLETLQMPESHYDLIILVQTLEHVAEPVELLQKIRSLLRPGGRLVVVTDNTRSLDFRLFKGRYWGGYHFPRHWYLFNPSTIRNLAEITDFTVDRLTTQVSPVNWTYSIHNWLVDRKAPSWLRSFFSLRSPIALSFFTVFDLLNQLLGRGALINATLCRPVEPVPKP